LAGTDFTAPAEEMDKHLRRRIHDFAPLPASRRRIFFLCHVVREALADDL